MKNTIHNLTRPHPTIHSVAEIISHLLEWRISVLSILKVDGEENHSYMYYTEGLIHHDMYHLGQIGLVIKMLSTA